MHTHTRMHTCPLFTSSPFHTFVPKQKSLPDLPCMGQVFPGRGAASPQGWLSRNAQFLLIFLSFFSCDNFCLFLKIFVDMLECKGVVLDTCYPDLCLVSQKSVYNFFFWKRNAHGKLMFRCSPYFTQMSSALAAFIQNFLLFISSVLAELFLNF